MPPSSDISRNNKSTRKSSGKKSGGQHGHKGKTLLQSSDPDIITDIKSEYCAVCGHHLSNEDFILKSKRQVVDIPPIQPVYHEYRQYSCTCPHCHIEQVGDYPQEVSAPIQYGNRIQALVAYLSVSQYIPYAQLAKMFSDIFSINLSEGSIQNLLTNVAKKAKIVHDRIKYEISKSGVVGSDETGARENGKKIWIWTWQDSQNTYIIPTASRGFKTINEEWLNGLPASVLVSDRLSAQLKTLAKMHQICLAHLLRESTYLEEEDNHSFSHKFKALIKDVFCFKRNQVKNYEVNSPETKCFEDKLNKYLSINIPKKVYPKTATFQKSLRKVRNYILPCIYIKEIPSDNNGSERAIRNIKVKQKISGQFKTGASIFCILRSVIDTCIKRNRNILGTLTQIISLNPNSKLVPE